MLMTSFSMCFLERLFHCAHPNLPAASGPIGKTLKCPFRAMMQGHGVHSSPPLSGAPQTKSASSDGEEGPATEGDKCKCVSSGLQPKGEPNTCNL
jgi:hypothetical protein